MLIARLIGCPWLKPDEREAALERFCSALEEAFGGEANVAVAQDAWLRACANYPGGVVPSEADPEDRAAADQWESALDDAKVAAFSPWPRLDQGCAFEIEFVA